MTMDGTQDIVVKVVMDGRGRVQVATAAMRIEAPVAAVWQLVEDVDGYAGRVPMIHRVIRKGDRATLQLKFKLTLFSVGFEFVVDVVKERERSLELRWVSGEPEGILLGYEIVPLDDGRACELRTTSKFDLTNLGWFAKYFLRHHPEIELGVVPGVAIGLLDAMRRGVEPHAQRG
jgi:ribosome-associated toxin RatA of RatAB toxin-antitoxin module